MRVIVVQGPSWATRRPYLGMPRLPQSEDASIKGEVKKAHPSNQPVWLPTARGSPSLWVQSQEIKEITDRELECSLVTR